MLCGRKRQIVCKTKAGLWLIYNAHYGLLMELVLKLNFQGSVDY